jgi:hypothetical protein
VTPSSERSHSFPKSIRSPPSTRAGGNAEGKPGQRSEAGMALECSVRSRRPFLNGISHGLPVENESSVKARIVVSRRVGPKHECSVVEKLFRFRFLQGMARSTPMVGAWSSLHTDPIHTDPIHIPTRRLSGQHDKGHRCPHLI